MTQNADPQPCEGSSDAERIDRLEQDNRALQQMVARLRQDFHNGGTPKKADDPSKEKSLLKAEQEKRRGLELLLVQEKDACEVAIFKRDAEIRTLQAQLLSLRQELAVQTARANENESLVQVLKKENFRLSELCSANKLESKNQAPSYFSNNQTVRTDRLKKDVPSSKPFSQVLRSLSPVLQRTVTPSRSATALSDPNKPSPLSKSSPRTRSPSEAKKTTVDPRGRSPQARASTPNRYSQANPHRGTRATAASPSKGVSVGSRVTWNGLQAIVRYAGPVHGLGDGEWLGLELSTEGKGDHNGTLNGVRYFSTAPLTAVFCSHREVTPAKDFTRELSAASQKSDSADASSRGKKSPEK